MTYTHKLVELVSQETRDRLFNRPYTKLTSMVDYAIVASDIESFMPIEVLETGFPEYDMPQVAPLSLKSLFANLATEVVGDRVAAVCKLVNSVVPEPPSGYLLRSGWMRYDRNGSATPVPYPDEVIAFDTETLVKKGNYPVVATAVSADAWFLWLHPTLAGETDSYENMLIPLHPKTTFVAHNAMFDMSRVAEAHSVAQSDLMAICTQSLHMLMNGIGGSKQRAIWTLIKNRRTRYQPEWATRTTGNSLVAVYEFHTGREWGSKVAKELRDLFVSSNDYRGIQERLGELVDYAFKDTYRTWEVSRILLNKFRNYCPHPATLAALMLDSQSLLYVDSGWYDHLLAADETFEQANTEIESTLKELVDNYIERWQLGELAIASAEKLKDCQLCLETSELVDSQGDRFDPWLSQLDWTPLKSGKNQGLPKWVSQFQVSKGLSLTKRYMPLLLRMTWQGYPLVFHKSKKWGIANGLKTREGFKWCGCWVTKYPHPKGETENCGDPLGKNYLDYLETGVLRSNVEL